MNLYDAVLQNGCVKRLGELTVVSLAQGYGGLVLDSLDFLTLRKWAQRRKSSENQKRDMQQFVDQIEIMVARVGSALPTKGAANRLLRLAKQMKNAGMNLDDWNIPRKVLEELSDHDSEEPASSRVPEVVAPVYDNKYRPPVDDISFDLELQRAMAILGLDLPGSATRSRSQDHTASR